MKIKKYFNWKYTQIALYVVGTFVIAFLLIRFWDNIGMVLHRIGRFVGWIGGLLSPAILGFVIAYLLTPLVRFLGKQLRYIPFFKDEKRSVKGLSVLLSYTLVIGIIVAVMSLLISTVTKEFRFLDFESLVSTFQMYVNSLSEAYVSLTKQLEAINIKSPVFHDYIASAGEFLTGFLQGMVKFFTSLLGDFGSIFTSFLFGIIFSIYFLLDGRRLAQYWDRALKAFMGNRVHGYFRQFVKDADGVFSGYIRGQLLDACLIGVITGVTQFLVGTPYATVIGLLVCLGTLIPYVGSIVGYISIIFVNLLDFNLQRLIIGAVVFFIFQTLDANVTQPKLLGSGVNVHPLVIILSVIIGGSTGGFLGMLLAVPLAALAKIYFERLVNYLMERRKLEAPAESGKEPEGPPEDLSEQQAK
ncbi:MAG: AI-2E family transporter [Lachnospiraceae bacterium]|nr:AI-2E family transporter [Lachnospiraceae bacterium]